MIAVPFPEPTDQDWLDWRAKCKSATDLLLALKETDPIEISDDLYKRQKAKIWAAFNGKCAYCEVLLIGNQRGDVEHWRPKKAVTDEAGKPVRNPITKREHRGYYWLAYDWRNLLPSCVECNQASTAANGARLGKRNRFPLEDEQARGYAPGEEINESPLLLHPFLDTPETELVFDKNGVVGGATDKGRATIDTLWLNRDGLQIERKRRWVTVRMMVTRLIQAVVEQDASTQTDMQAQLDEYQLGVAPYSALGRFIWKQSREALRSLGV